MWKRTLQSQIEELAFENQKIAFLSGPRQCGKTTLSKAMLAHSKLGAYYNWDEIEFRRQWAKHPNSILDQFDTGMKRPLIIFDEIHKAKLWKRTLKGIYDTLQNPADILVTGSARLNIYNKGSDSLLGRYLHFRLHPLSLGELTQAKKINSPDEFLTACKEKAFAKPHYEELNALFRFGGFPEPLAKGSDRFWELWRRGRVEKIVREDLRDLSRLPDLSKIEMLCALLPEKVGGLFSLTSLREDLETQHNTVKRWLNYLSELYYFFEVKPHTESIARSLKKEGKMFLWDWSEVQDQGGKFENMIASHLLKACHYWTDLGYGKFELKTIRNKEKKELDFLILKGDKPFFTCEAKLSETNLDTTFLKFKKLLGKTPHFQVHMNKKEIYRKEIEGTPVVVLNAGCLLGLLP